MKRQKRLFSTIFCFLCVYCLRGDTVSMVTLLLFVNVVMADFIAKFQVTADVLVLFLLLCNNTIVYNLEHHYYHLYPY